MAKIIAPVEITRAIYCEVQISLTLSCQVELGSFDDVCRARSYRRHGRQGVPIDAINFS
jgi:hypothetical protein